MIYLALTLWPLGDVERARQFADRALDQAAKSGNVPTLVYVNYHLCFFEAMRRDPLRTLPLAEAILDLGEARAMPIWENSRPLLSCLGKLAHWRPATRIGGNASWQSSACVSLARG